MFIESPEDTTYTLDARVIAARTITDFYAKTDSGTCFVQLKNATDVTTISGITASSTGLTGSISNASVDQNDRLRIEVSSSSTPVDLEIVVGYEQ